MPPGSSTPSQPGPKAECAPGSYTRNDHSSMKTRNVLNLARSAKAPVMRAGVMMANIAWKIMNASWGTVGGEEAEARRHEHDEGGGGQHPRGIAGVQFWHER